LSEVDPIDNGIFSENEDAHNIAAALSGDGEAYRRLVERYQTKIAGQMRRFSRDPTVQTELTQDVFVEAYMSLQSYHGTAPWLHWLRRIAVRVGYRYWSSRQACGRECNLSEDDWRRLQGSFPEPTDATDAADLVFALLAQLTANDRLILTLIYLDGCTIAEAADRAGWTAVGAKVRAFRARNRLRKLIEESSHEK